MQRARNFTFTYVSEGDYVWGECYAINNWSGMISRYAQQMCKGLTMPKMRKSCSKRITHLWHDRPSGPGASGMCAHYYWNRVELYWSYLNDWDGERKRKTIDEKLITLQSNSQGCHERNELRNDGLRKQPQRGIEFVKMSDIRRITNFTLKSMLTYEGKII